MRFVVLWITSVGILSVACYLDDLLAPGTPTQTIVPDSSTDDDSTDAADPVRVVTLILLPIDTTLTVPNDSVCLRWAARDSAGQVIPDVTPTFALVSNPGNRLALAATPGCVRALAVGPGAAGRVRATTDSATAEALIRANP